MSVTFGLIILGFILGWLSRIWYDRRKKKSII